MSNNDQKRAIREECKRRAASDEALAARIHQLKSLGSPSA